MKLRLLYLLFFGYLTLNLAANGFSVIPNKGQWESNILCKAYIPNGVLIIDNKGWTMQLYDYHSIQVGHGSCHEEELPPDSLQGHNIRYKWLQASPINNVDYLMPENTYNNFYLGKDRSKWKSNVANYKALTIKNLYPGIDLSIYGTDEGFKYDYILKKWANPNDIKLEILGADSILVNNKSLQIYNQIETINEHLPLIYYSDKNSNSTSFISKKNIVEGNYLLDGNLISYSLKNLESNRPLVIDPNMVFSSYSGSYVPHWGFTATHDMGSNTYSGGVVFGALVTDTFPTTPGSFMISWAGGLGAGFNITHTDATIQKFDSTGQLLFSTFLGGFGGDRPHSLTINDKNELIVLGTTSASDFPISSNAYDTSFNGLWDLFICKLNDSGSQLIASTYLGGSNEDGVNISNVYSDQLSLKYNYADDSRGDISVDENYNIYIATCSQSSDFPISNFAFQDSIGGLQDAVVSKFNDDLSHLMYSTFLGGEHDDAAYSVYYKDQITYITGGTRSEDFPTTNHAVQSSFGGDSADAFISALNIDGSQLIASTYWGTERYDQAFFVQLDNDANVYVLGQTRDTSQYFLHNEQYYNLNGSQFISKFSPKLDSVLLSMTFGSGSDTVDIVPSAFMVDVCNKIFISGWGGVVNNYGNMMNLPITSDAFQDSTDGSDYYLMVLDQNATSLIYASYIGSPTTSEHVDGGTSRFDKRGIIHQAVCAGCANDSNFPTTLGAWSNTNNSTTNCNAATFQFDFEFPTLYSSFSLSENSGCAPLEVSFTSLTNIYDSNLVSYHWDFGDGNIDSLTNTIHTYSNPGEYLARLIVEDPSTCNIRDTLEKRIRVFSDSAHAIPDLSVCANSNTQIGILPNADPSIQYQWLPPYALSNSNISNPIAFPDSTQNYKLLITDGNCTDTIYQTLHVLSGSADSMETVEICKNDTIEIGLSNTNNFNFQWLPHPSIEDSSSAMTRVYPDSTYTFTLITQNNFCGDTFLQKVLVQNHEGWDFQQDTSICNGESVQIGLSPIPGLNYQWSPSTYLNNASFAQPISTPLSSITYYLGMSQSNCKAKDSIVINVRPTPDIELSSNQQICYGDSVNLNVNGAQNYLWYPDSSLNQAQGSIVIAKPITNTYFKVIGTYANLCADLDSVLIIVDPELKVDAGANDSICLGQSINLTANILSPGTPGAPAPYAFSWSPAQELNHSHLLQVQAQPTESTLFYLTVTDGHLCQSIDSIYIHLGPKSPMPLNGDTSVCINDSIQIGFIDTSSGLNYTWNPGQVLSPILYPLCWVKPINSGFFKLIPDDTTCQKADSIYIEVLQLPTLNAGQDSTICKGDSLQLMATGNGNIEWSPQDGINNPNSLTSFCSPTDTQIYILKITDSMGCANFDTLQINVLYKPNIYAGKDTTICIGSSVAIGILDTSNQGYYWIPGTYLSDSLDSYTTASPDSSIKYILKHINTQCSSEDSVQINVFPTPNLKYTEDTSACLQDSFLLGANGGLFYYWQADSSLIQNNIDSPKIWISNNLNVFINITDSNLCLFSDSIFIQALPNPNVDLGPDTSLCLGDSIIIGFTDSSTMQYIWSDSNIIDIINPSLALTYPSQSQFIYITPVNLSCAQKDSLWIEVFSLPNIIINNDTSICKNDSLELIGHGGESYLWTSNNYIAIDTSINTWSIIDSSAFYFLNIVDSNSCKNRDSFYVELLYRPNYNLGTIQYYCKGDSFNYLILDSLIDSLVWTPNTLNDSSPNEINLLLDSNINLYLESWSGQCYHSDSLKINIDSLTPQSNFEFYFLPSCTAMNVHFENLSQGHTQSIWSGNGLLEIQENPIIALPYESMSNIQLKTISSTGCKDSFSLDLNIPSFKEKILDKTANIFTPNGDGQNDCFTIFESNSELAQCGKWKVYNRWGNLVYESDDPNQCWDGNLNNNKPAKEGVYFYIFMLENWSITNYLQLIR